MSELQGGRPKDPWLDRAWTLLPNRVSRFYRGGMLLDAFRAGTVEGSVAHAVDGDRPEDWVGSATRAWTRPGEPPTSEGLSAARLDGEPRLVADLVREHPAEVGGEDLTGLGSTTGILVKLLDAGSRLPVHAHPSRAFAREHLGSPFGKAEAWIVLGTRPDLEQPGEIRLGFRRDVGREELRHWIDEERSADLLETMHRRPTAAGDVWFVPPGTPHAIGAGVFILEVQEPTDFSIVLETAGFPIDREDASLRLGWDVAIDAIERDGLDDDAVDRLRSTIDVGLARTPAADLAIRQGDTFGVPAAAVSSLELITDDRLEIIACGSSGLPPSPVTETAGAAGPRR